MKSAKWIFGGLLLTLLTGSLWAEGANPYGSGFIGIGLGLQPATRTQFALSEFEHEDTDLGTYLGEQLGGGFPLSRFFGMDVSVEQVSGSISSSIAGSQYSNTDASSVTNGNLGLEFFPAAFVKDTYAPGHDSNPDGWLWSPSLTLGVTLEDDDERYTLKSPFTSSSNSLSQQAYNGVLGVNLPMTTWLSVEAADMNNVDVTGDGGNGRSYFNQTDLILKSYINLVRGADSDVNRRYIPSIGRLGQLEVGLDWGRAENTSAEVLISQQVTLSVAAPLNAGFSLGLSMDGVYNGASYLVHNYMSYVYALHLTYAFGNPARRVDR